MPRRQCRSPILLHPYHRWLLPTRFTTASQLLRLVRQLRTVVKTSSSTASLPENWLALYFHGVIRWVVEWDLFENLENFESLSRTRERETCLCARFMGGKLRWRNNIIVCPVAAAVIVEGPILRVHLHCPIVFSDLLHFKQHKSKVLVEDGLFRRTVCVHCCASTRPRSARIVVVQSHVSPCCARTRSRLFQVVVVYSQVMAPCPPVVLVHGYDHTQVVVVH